MCGMLGGWRERRRGELPWVEAGGAASEHLTPDDVLRVACDGQHLLEEILRAVQKWLRAQHTPPGHGRGKNHGGVDV